MIVAAILLAGVTGLLLMPMPDHGLEAPGNIDKLVHFVMFFCVAVPALVGMIRFWPHIMLGLILYGGLIELIQPQFGRHADWGDFVANSLGVIAAFPLALTLRYWIGSKYRQLPQRKRTGKDDRAADL